MSVTIDCQTVELGTYAFGGCDDLESVTICNNGRADNQIKLDNQAFVYCGKLQTVTIGRGNISMGEYPPLAVVTTISPSRLRAYSTLKK